MTLNPVVKSYIVANNGSYALVEFTHLDGMVGHVFIDRPKEVPVEQFERDLPQGSAIRGNLVAECVVISDEVN